jgi:nucleoside-diphosphate-sugar epimerase
MKILMVGAGWVCTHAASLFIEAGHEVQGISKSQTRWYESPIAPQHLFQWDFEAPQTTLPTGLWREVDAVIVSIPLQPRNGSQTNPILSNLLTFLKQIQSPVGIYLSSIGIYPNHSGTYTEESPIVGHKQQDRAYTETLITQNFPQAYVLRLGGLFGKDRIFAKYFVGKTYTKGEELAHFIHVDDVAGILLACLELKAPSGIYNVICPARPSKKEVIMASAVKYGFATPVFSDFDGVPDRMISSEKLNKHFDIVFKYPNPIGF